MRMSEPCEACTTCAECGRHYCREDYSACPDCPTPDPERCGRVDEHEPHEWRCPAGHGPYSCLGTPLVEGGWAGDAA